MKKAGDLVVRPTVILAVQGMWVSAEGQGPVGIRGEQTTALPGHDSSNSSPPVPMRESAPTREMKPSLV